MKSLLLAPDVIKMMMVFDVLMAIDWGGYGLNMIPSATIMKGPVLHTHNSREVKR